MRPEVVTSTMAIQPTHALTVGDKIEGIKGRSTIVKVNSWTLSSEPHVDSFDFRDHIEWLLQQLEPRAKTLQAFQEEAGIRMWCTCIWWSRHGSGGPVLRPDQMTRMAALRLELQLEASYFGPETEQSL
jgi:hypothetical protein